MANGHGGLESYESGDLVRYLDRGVGEVKSVEVRGSERDVVVEVDGVEYRLAVGLAPLEKVTA